MRVEWRYGGWRTYLVRVTEVGRMLGSDPNMALSVPYGLGMWKARRSKGGGGGRPAAQEIDQGAGGSGPQQGLPQAVEQQQQYPSPPPPPRAPKNQPRHFKGSREEPPAPHTHTNPLLSPRQRLTPPPQPRATPLENMGPDPYGNVRGVGDTRYVPWAEGGNGGTVTPSDRNWWVVSQGVHWGAVEEGEEGGEEEEREREGHLPGVGGPHFSHLGGGGGLPPVIGHG